MQPIYRKGGLHGFQCGFCNAKAVHSKVELVVNKRLVDTFTSAIAAWNAFEETQPFEVGYLRYIYRCENCGREYIYHERPLRKVK